MNCWPIFGSGFLAGAIIGIAAFILFIMTLVRADEKRESESELDKPNG